MNFNEYQKQAATFAISHIKSDISYYALGLSSETGEIADKIKKSIRDGDTDNSALILELGDVLWYLSGLADILEVSLETVAVQNIEKLKNRKARGTIKGSGDYR